MTTRYLLEKSALPVLVAAMLALTAAAFADDETPAASASVSEERLSEAERAPDRNWKVRFFAAIAGDGGLWVASGASHSGVEINGGGGVGVNFEYRTSPRMGFEIGAMALGGNIRVGTASKSHWNDVGVAVDGYVPVTFALNYHPVKNSEIVDFYVGPLAASTFLSSVGVGPGVAIDSRVEFGLGANLGADINFGRSSRWSFSASCKYISNVTGSGDRETRVEFDPLIFSFGFGFKF